MVGYVSKTNFKFQSYLNSRGVDTNAPLSPERIRRAIVCDWHLQQEVIIEYVERELTTLTFGDFARRFEAALHDMPYATKALQRICDEQILQELCSHIDLEGALYRLAILDVLIKKAEKDFLFFRLAYEEYSRLIKQKYTVDGSLKKLDMLRNGTLFTYVKYLTIDSSIRSRLRVHEESNGIETFRKKRLLRFFMLPLNVVEAAVTDIGRANFKNAFSGLLLASSPLQQYSYDSKNRKLLLYCRPGYEEPYLLWNLAFCLRNNSSQIHAVIPKLLYPEILLSRGSDFIAHRSLSLWFSLQTIFLTEDKKLSLDRKILADRCAGVIEDTAYDAVRSFKQSVSWEFFMNMYKFYRSEDFASRRTPQ